MKQGRRHARLICPLPQADPAGMRAAADEAVAAGADTIEYRLDFLAAPPDGAALRTLFANAPAETIATCRPPREGGRFAG